jgi:hypothetical protein
MTRPLLGWGRRPSVFLRSPASADRDGRRRNPPTRSGRGHHPFGMRFGLAEVLAGQQPYESAPSGLTALLAAPVTAHHAQSEPHQRPKKRGGHSEKPKRPGETPEEEVEADALGVLDHEDEQQPYAAERGDRSTAESASFRGRSRAVASPSFLDSGSAGRRWGVSACRVGP